MTVTVTWTDKKTVKETDRHKGRVTATEVGAALTMTVTVRMPATVRVILTVTVTIEVIVTELE